MADDDDHSDYDDDNDSPVEDDEEERNKQVLAECLQSFERNDYIMEPGVFKTLKRYFQAEGPPHECVQLLSDNYVATSQTANLLAEWLIQAGVDIKDVQELVERQLTEMVIKFFDPLKANSIFKDEDEHGESGWLKWLTEMIEYPTWRNLFYKLAEEYPDCLMLNFTIKLISDSGHQGEITSVSTACNQIEVFSRVLKTSISGFLEGGPDAINKHLPEFTKMVCHGEHTYLYSQLIIHILSHENKGGSNVRRLCQEVHIAAKQRGLDVTPITLALSGAAKYPRACQALHCMLSCSSLNPADISILYKMYSSSDPPPVEIIRTPQFLDLFINSLFTPGAKINLEYKSMYVYILAYASSVIETWKKNNRKQINKDELKITQQAIERAHALCSANKGSSELIVDIGLLFESCKYPVVAMGILKWVDLTVSDISYFKLNTDHTPLHLVLLDEISTNHQLLHGKVLDLLTRLFESQFEELDVMEQLQLKKTIVDRMVHLFCQGSVLPVVQYIRNCLTGDTDISLIRHFVMEVLDVIAPPYTSEFVEMFLPVIENDEITGSLRNDSTESDPVTEFIMHCRTMS